MALDVVKWRGGGRAFWAAGDCELFVDRPQTIGLLWQSMRTFSYGEWDRSAV